MDSFRLGNNDQGHASVEMTNLDPFIDTYDNPLAISDPFIDTYDNPLVISSMTVDTTRKRSLTNQ